MAITFEEALEIAKGLKTKIEFCDEYDIGYVFMAQEDRFAIGGDGACCVLKNNGDAVNQLTFFDTYSPKLIKRIEVG